MSARNDNFDCALGGELPFYVFEIGRVVEGLKADGMCNERKKLCITLYSKTKEMEDVYNIVLLAHEKGRDALKAGVLCKDADAAARKVIEEAGYGEYFTHSLGHGVGIEIHESPRLSKTSEDVLKVGDVVTVEPGIYIENKFGVRIENMYVITRDGYENLTVSDKKLIKL